MPAWLLLVACATVAFAMFVSHVTRAKPQAAVTGRERLPQLTSSPDLPGRRVGAVKDRIGALRLDVGWVIENPAFFDVDSPTSAELFRALAQWDDNRTTWTLPQLRAAADSIEGLYVQSRRRAEHLGMSHLHGETRETVETASKLIRKAMSTASEQERQALMAKAAEILAKVIGVVAPAETARELERQAAPRQIDPRNR